MQKRAFILFPNRRDPKTKLILPKTDAIFPFFFFFFFFSCYHVLPRYHVTIGVSMLFCSDAPLSFNLLVVAEMGRGETSNITVNYKCPYLNKTFTLVRFLVETFQNQSIKWATERNIFTLPVKSQFRFMVLHCSTTFAIIFLFFAFVI